MPSTSSTPNALKRQAATRWAAIAAALATAALQAGCTTTSLVLGAAGLATDTSIAWAIAKHVHEKATDGDPVSCGRLDSVQRALSERCGAFVPGSLQVADVNTSRMQVCPLIQAAQEPRYWPVLPELIAKGAQPEHCLQSPLLRLAQRDACPDFSAASPEQLRALTWLAEADARAIRHDVVRMISCPSARTAGLHRVLDHWLASGSLRPDSTGFGVLGALHPSYLSSPFARSLERSGHTAQAALGAFEGKQPAGFEAALRAHDVAALDWWLLRVPSLANSVPPTQGDQLAWVPLARVLVPSFLSQPQRQGEAIEYLLSHGANPGRRLPYDERMSVLAYARSLNSPWVATLEKAAPARVPRTVLASGFGSGSASEDAEAFRAPRRNVTVMWNP